MEDSHGSAIRTNTSLVYILIIALIVFGSGKLLELGRGFGRGIREFKQAIQGIKEEAPNASGTKLLK